jgi:hypothetical protein
VGNAQLDLAPRRREGSGAKGRLLVAEAHQSLGILKGLQWPCG